ncbi:MAG: hypothetical protein L0Y56_00700 [Nitrospira sp.]|nr:hypothetical protein [Nitrospira sp.]
MLGRERGPEKQQPSHIGRIRIMSENKSLEQELAELQAQNAALKVKRPGRKPVPYDQVADAFRQAKNLLGLESHILPVRDDDTACVIVSGDGHSVTRHKNSEALKGLRFALDMSKEQTRFHPRAPQPRE